MPDPTLTQDLIDGILAHNDGMLEKQSAVATKIVRTRIREDGFQRQILPFVNVTNADLAYLPDSELPALIEELEPDSPAAKSIGYNDTPDTVFFRGEKFMVLINIITTEELTKNLNELRTYKNDIKQIITDNMLRDIQTEEDSKFIATVRRICGNANIEADGGQGNGTYVEYAAANVDHQYVRIDSPITRESYKVTRNFLEDRDLNIATALINRRTANQFLGWDRSEIGGDKAESMALKGLKALDSFEIMGINHIATIKRDLVANGEVYQFASPDFLGRAYKLEDIKITIKKDYDIIRMRAQEQVGLTIGNTRGVQRLIFANERPLKEGDDGLDNNPIT